MKFSTIGFTKKSARQFFDLLRTSGAKPVVDLRLNMASKRKSARALMGG